jgi:hypothetical protein
MKMDYLGIVLEGYFNENNREFLEKYFLREYKKYEKEQFFEADEFFNGCLKVAEDWEKYLQKQVFERKNQLCLMLNEAKKGTLIFDNMEGKTIEQRRAELIENCENELQNVRPDGIGCLTFTVNMWQLTNGRVIYHLTYKEILEIKDAINKAFEKTKILEETPSIENKTLQNNTLSSLITHPKGAEIIKGVKLQYKGIKGKRLKLLLIALQELELLPKERVANKFYDYCKLEFDWNIASYNAMNGYNYNSITDKEELKNMKSFIEKITKDNKNL